MTLKPSLSESLSFITREYPKLRYKLACRGIALHDSTKMTMFCPTMDSQSPAHSRHNENRCRWNWTGNGN